MDEAVVEQIVTALDHYVHSFDREQVADIVRIVLAVEQAAASQRHRTGS